MEHGSLLEVNTQTLPVGGIDLTPAGYRLVSLAGDRLRLIHRTVVEEPLVRVMYPRDGTCVASGPGGAAVPMTFAGGWAFTADVEVTGPQHTLA